MIVAIEFYIRSLNMRDNLPVPCSFCLENIHGDRKVVTLNAAYRHPELVAVRHWLLSECAVEQSLPVLSEKLVPKEEVYDHDFVVVPKHKILAYHSPFIPYSFNLPNKPMTHDKFSSLYDNFLRIDIHNYYKETWIWREFFRVYIPFMPNIVLEERIDFQGFSEEFRHLREAMTLVMKTQPELWHKWLHWRKYMIDFQEFPGEVFPGEVAFCREYGPESFSFCLRLNTEFSSLLHISL